MEQQGFLLERMDQKYSEKESSKTLLTYTLLFSSEYSLEPKNLH